MFSERVSKVELSGIRKFFEMADENTINLGIGQPDFQPPRSAIEAYRDAMLNGHNGYGSTSGLVELREEIAKEYSKYRPGLTKDNVLIHTGATQGLKIITESLVDDHIEVLCPQPGFVLYEAQVRLAGGNTISYPLKKENDFIPTLEDLEERRTPNTKAMIVNSPSNPSGAVYPDDRIKEMVDWAKEHDIVVISDEVYEKLVYGEDHKSFLGKGDNVVMVNSFSKRFAMTGWRIGFSIAREDWIKKLGKINYYNIACPPNPTQHAALHALRNESDFVEKMYDTFLKRRDIIVDRLNQIEGFDCMMPKGAFYVFPRYSFDMGAEELAKKILENGVLAVPGTAFGPAGKGHIRFSYANSKENINKALDIIEDAAADWKIDDG
ncbi:MAG: pyridoxal phosphate-dependent aminotransferase [Candidatus Thermoplasmatota archaeon]|nr:pyridoxal phosphate-dependent aminotransferase [Candidatus Thermoplasmatota archaeon]